MSCCNNDCLENIPAGCVNSPEGLSCVEGDNVGDNLVSINTMLEQLYCNNPSGLSVIDQYVEVDLKCLANTNCEEVYFNYALAKNTNATGGWIATVNLEGVFTSPYIANYSCFINGALYSSSTGSYFQVTGPSQAQLINGVVIIVNVNNYTPTGVSIYSKSITLYPSTPPLASAMFECVSSNSIQVLKLKDLLSLIIDKIC